MPGYAHGGVLAAALDEAMALLLYARDEFALTRRLEVDLRAPAPVGAFVRVEAELEESDSRSLRLRASAVGEDGRELARARGVFVRANRPEPWIRP